MQGRRFRSLWVRAVTIVTAGYLFLLVLMMVAARVFGLGKIGSALFIGMLGAVLIGALAHFINLLDLYGRLCSTWQGGGTLEDDSPELSPKRYDSGEEEGQLELLAEHDRLGLPDKELRDKYRTLVKMAEAAKRQQKRLALAEPEHGEGFMVAMEDLLYRMLGAVGTATCAGYALGTSNLLLGLLALVPGVAGEIVTRLNDPDRLLRVAMSRVEVPRD